MKKIIGLTFLIGAICVSTSTMAQKKIGHVNLDSILKAMPQSDSARKVGQAYYQQLENTIESMQKELQQKNQEYQQKVAPHLTDGGMQYQLIDIRKAREQGINAIPRP